LIIIFFEFKKKYIQIKDTFDWIQVEKLESMSHCLVEGKNLINDFFFCLQLCHFFFFLIAECHLENCIPVDEFNKRFGEIDSKLTEFN